MHISKVLPSDISTKRLDSDFYRPDYLENDKILEAHELKTLGSSGKFFAGPFGSKLPSSLYLSEGIPLFRVSNVGLFEVNEDGFAYLAPEVHSELASSEVVPGDLLVVKASVGEKICRVPETIRKANITQHIIAIRPNLSVDMDFISAFLVSDYGRKQLERYSLGSIIQYLGINDARAVNYIYIDPLAQKYIGEKVRQAERLMTWSKHSTSQLQVLFKQQYKPIDAYDSFDKKAYKLKPKSVYDVITPGSYPPNIDAYFKDNPFLYLGDITEAIFTGSTKSNATDQDVAVNQATSRSCNRLFLRKPFNQVVKPEKGRYLRKKDLLLTNAAHDKAYIGKDVSFYHSDDENLPSSKVAVIRLKESTIPASYLHTYLMSDAGYIQWQSIVRGISAGIHPGDIGRIRIPTPKEGAVWEKIKQTADVTFVLAGDCSETSGRLTEAAKLIIESFIDGQITEQQLVSAQQALDIGDNSLDQDILSRLTIKGFDAGGDPLFSDLDKLYDLLAQSQQQGA